jgi:hypothetical protein
MRELSPDARRLLDEVAGSDGPSVARRARVKKRLAAQLAASGVALSAAQLAAAASGPPGAALTAAAVSKGALSVGTVALWLAGGALAGTLLMVPVTLSRNERPSGAASAPLVVQPLSSTSRKLVAALPRGEPTPTTQNEDTGAIREEPASGGSASPRHDGRPAAPALGLGAEKRADGLPAQPNVGAETALLESAQRELASGQGERALELLERHEARFPNAALSEERAFARVIALCQLGRRAEARASAEAFLRLAPRSPLLPRLRKSCAFKENSQNGSEAP